MEPLVQWQADLRHSDLQVRAAAAENLCQAGPDAAVAAVELVRACGDEEDVRQWAVGALEELGTPPDDTQEELVKLAGDADPLVAYWAVTLIGRLGPAAQPSEACLAGLLGANVDLAVRERAAWALGKIEAQGQATRQALEVAAESDQARLARLAKAALEQCPS